MSKDASILYKLMILFMLDKVNFPLSYSQISNFMLNGYTNYFNLQNVLNDLRESDFVLEERLLNTTQYQITHEGRNTLNLLEDQISNAIQEDIREYLVRNKYELKNETNVTSTYYKAASKDFIIHCQVREAGESLIELQLSVPDEDTANRMCINWKEASQEIYLFIYKNLLKEAKENDA